MHPVPITPDDWRKLADQLASHQLWLHGLKKRLFLRGIRSDDPIVLAIDKTLEGLQWLRMDAHYRSTTGTGRPPQE